MEARSEDEEEPWLVMMTVGPVGRPSSRRAVTSEKEGEELVVVG
jgi:hypothetical protein